MYQKNLDSVKIQAGLNINQGRAFELPLEISELKDEQLVERFVSQRDEEAFGELVNRYSDKVYGLAYRITGDPTDAEEVLQEVFIILVEKLGTFRAESKFSTWLYRVASNAGYMFLRSGKKHQNASVSIDDYKPYNDYGVLEGVKDNDWSATPDSELLSREGSEKIEKAISELPEDYRVVFHMKDVEGLTSKEIAKALGLSLPAVKSRVLRARLFLRDRLTEYFKEGEGK